MLNYRVIAADPPFMIYFFERNTNEVFLRIARVRGTTLHVAIAEVYSRSNQNLLSIENEHEKDRGVGILPKFALASLPNPLNMPLRWRTRTKIKTYPAICIISRVDDTLSSDVSLERVFRICA